MVCLFVFFVLRSEECICERVERCGMIDVLICIAAMDCCFDIENDGGQCY